MRHSYVVGALVMPIRHCLDQTHGHGGVLRNWSACMAMQAFHSSDANTFSQQAEIMLGQRTAPGQNPAGPPGQPTAAQNKTQIAMAVADANCTLSSDLSGIYFAVQGNYEKQFVSALNALRNCRDESYRLITLLLRILSVRSVRAREVAREVSIVAERGA